ncbi:hypothetical protein LguiA_007102 [Lonicera macranthoides]
MDSALSQKNGIKIEDMWNQPQVKCCEVSASQSISQAQRRVQLQNKAVLLEMASPHNRPFRTLSTLRLSLISH